MKTIIMFLFFLFSSVVLLFAGGKTEETQTTHNNEWTICITAFDSSSLPPSRRIIGDILARDLAAALKRADRHYRDNEETVFYEEYVWAKARSAAASALSAKRNERDLLVFQGDAGWKYRKNLRTKDAEIEKLEDALNKIDAERPLVNPEPAVKFVEANRNGTWPAPPSLGTEYRFCIDQKIDAFITGQLSEFHGRVYINLKMYTFHTRSYSYEDMIIFSSEDIQEALDELSGRLFTAILGTGPAELAIRVQPEDAIVLVDGAYAGRGETELTGYAPGFKEIEVFVENYVPEYFLLELNARESAELYINLTPLGRESLTVNVPGNEGASVYMGSLYLGDAPLSLELPRNEPAYITVETSGGETGSAVFRGGRVIRGSANFSRTGEGSLAYSTALPVDPDEKRVHTAKLKFYGSYGRFWIALPVSMILAGIAENYEYAYQYKPTQEMYDLSLPWSGVKIGAYALLGVAAVDMVYRIVRYLYISRLDADPLAQFPKSGEN